MQPSGVADTSHSDDALSNGSGPGSKGVEIPLSESLVIENASPDKTELFSRDSEPDPYRGVVLVLLVAAVVGMIFTFEAGSALGNPVLIDAGLTLGLAAGILGGVGWMQEVRRRPLRLESAAPGLAEILRGEEDSLSSEREEAENAIRKTKILNRRWRKRLPPSQRFGPKLLPACASFASRCIAGTRRLRRSV
jgi:hypothetical protein